MVCGRIYRFRVRRGCKGRGRVSKDGVRGCVWICWKCEKSDKVLSLKFRGV